MAACGIAIAAPAIASPGHAHHPDRVVAGTLTTEVTPCDSLCTESEWTGVLDGVSSFSLISMSDADIPGENVSRFHGHLALSTAHGDLIGTDLGVWNLDSGHYVDVYTVTSGSDELAGASGVIVLFGTLDPVTGSGFSHYQGLLTWR
ncbi:MAG TPA: hypothetical protein VFP84_40750 [Kofleriaceae bacterium]|nr:hypothetical protein [Kofleriaceae bacterium]